MTRSKTSTSILGSSLRALGTLGLILVFSFMWTVFIPGYVAARDGVFYAEDMVQHLPPPIRMLYEAHQAQEQELKGMAQRLDEAILRDARLIDIPGSTIDSSDALRRTRALLDLQSRLKSRAHSQSAITVAPFFLNPQLWLWPAIYCCLGVIAIMLRPPSSLRGSSLDVSPFLAAALGISIYVLYEWPLWVRNFLLGNHGRTLYAYTNFDIDPASFFMQEAVIFGFCLLLGIIWLQWFRLPMPSRVRADVVTEALNEDTLRTLADLLFRWQYMSIVLALGFGFFTNFFWQLVFRFHDQRYVISALFAHLLWAITWIAISLPLVVRWQHWESVRSEAIVKLEQDHAQLGPAKQSIIESLRNLQPGGFGTLVASAIAAAASFALPVLRELIGK